MNDISTHTKDVFKEVCNEIYERWDKDMRSGKLLAVMRAGSHGYDARVDTIVKAVNSHEVYEALLGKAAEWFDEYARSHATKAEQAVDSYEAQSRRDKASTNAQRRDELRQALSTVRGQA